MAKKVQHNGDSRLVVKCEQCGDLTPTWFQIERYDPRLGINIPVILCKQKCLIDRLSGVNQEMRQLTELICTSNETFK